MNASRLQAKAERAVAAAERALASGDPETAADRAYYAVFYSAWGLLDGLGLPRPKTHHGLISEFSKHFVRNGPLTPAQGAVLSRLENLRIAAEYTLEPIPLADAERAVKEARAFLEWVRLTP